MSGLAHWIAVIRDTGVSGQDFARVRRLRAVNVASCLAALVTFGYCLFNTLYDITHFRTEVLFLLAVVCAYLSVLLITRTGRVGPAMWLLITIALVHLAVISWLLGRNSGAMLYLLVVPFLMSLLIDEGDRITIWPVSLATVLLFVFLAQNDRPGSIDALPERTRAAIFLVNTLGPVLVASGFALFFRWLILKVETKLERERRRSDRLLHAILPASVARRLKRDTRKIVAQQVPVATAVFADIVGFTAWSADKDPETVVIELNRIFSAADALSQRHGIEKIKTIGDAYFAVSGVPDPVPDHVERAADFALDLQLATRSLSSQTWPNPRFRIVLNTGRVVAGVIGRTKFAYDVWGNTINTAARMEDHCPPGDILMTGATADALPARFIREDMGTVDLRDRGRTRMFRLLARR